MATKTKFGSLKKTQKSLRCKLLIFIVTILLLLTMILAVVFVLLLRTSTQDDLIEVSDIIRSTRCGPVQGIIERSPTGQEALVFKGIPYAKPPIGQRRWKPPEDLDRNRPGKRCWDGVYNATKFGNLCAQGNFMTSFNPVGSEDCLFLNVWTKKMDVSTQLPVLVWIHGGGLLGGSGHAPGYSPNADLIHSMNVVAVSMNYRVNAFGFMALDVLANNSPRNASGNYGFMDQIHALKWIKENIREFGGNPDLVTIMGESGGGKAVYALLASPMASGLFHRAIVMSGPPVYTKTHKEAAKDNAVFIDRANCSRKTESEILECLYNLSTVEILKAIPVNVFPFWSIASFFQLPRKNVFHAALGVIDTAVVPVSPLSLANQTNFIIKPVPVLISSLAQEIETEEGRNLTNQTLEVLERTVHDYLDTFSHSFAKEALKLYIPSNKSIEFDHGLAFINMATDVRMTCPTNIAVRRLLDVKGQTVYQLMIENRPSKVLTFYGRNMSYAFHGWDAVALFGFFMEGIGDVGPKKLYAATKKDMKFCDDLRWEFASFMKVGHPESKIWHSAKEGFALSTETGLKFQRSSYHAKECQFWESKGMFSYGWN